MSRFRCTSFIVAALLASAVAVPAAADFAVSVNLGYSSGSPSNYRFIPAPRGRAPGYPHSTAPVIIVIQPTPIYPVVAPVSTHCWRSGTDLRVKVPGRSYVYNR